MKGLMSDRGEASLDQTFVHVQSRRFLCSIFPTIHEYTSPPLGRDEPVFIDLQDLETLVTDGAPICPDKVTEMSICDPGVAALLFGDEI